MVDSEQMVKPIVIVASMAALSSNYYCMYCHVVQLYVLAASEAWGH